MHDDQLHEELLFTEEFALAVPAGHPLAGDDGPVDLRVDAGGPELSRNLMRTEARLQEVAESHGDELALQVGEPALAWSFNRFGEAAPPLLGLRELLLLLREIAHAGFHNRPRLSNNRPRSALGLLVHHAFDRL